MDLRTMLASGDSAHPNQPGVPECSRKACRKAALWKVAWNNPSIHTPERRKIWLACDEHRPWLESFLQQRLFWRSTEALTSEDSAGTGDGEPSGQGPLAGPSA